MTMDLEARAHSEHPEALRLWLRLLTCSQLIEKRVRAGLREQFDTTLLQGTGELHDTGLVRNAEQGTADWASVIHLYFVLKFKFTGQIFTERSGRSIDCILFSGGIFYTKSNGGRIFIAC